MSTSAPNSAPIGLGASEESTPHLRRDAEENRRRVLAAATEVFAEHGLDASVEEIAAAAGVGMGTLYRRFPNKEALIEQLVTDVFAQLTALAEEALAVEDGTGLEVFLWQCGALQEGSRGWMSRIWHSDAHRRSVVELDAIMAQLLHRAQVTGRVRAECTTTDLSVLMWALRGVIDSGGPAAHHAWQRHLEFALAGLRPGAAAITRPPLTIEQRLRAGAQRREPSEALAKSSRR